MVNRFSIGLMLSLLASVVCGQKTTITVLDSANNPVPNAHILVQQTNKFIVSDNEGRASIDFKDRKELTIEVSFIGYLKLVKTILPNKALKLMLKEDVVTLNSFVVTGLLALSKIVIVLIWPHSTIANYV